MLKDYTSSFFVQGSSLENSSEVIYIQRQANFTFVKCYKTKHKEMKNKHIKFKICTRVRTVRSEVYVTRLVRALQADYFLALFSKRLLTFGKAFCVDKLGFILGRGDQQHAPPLDKELHTDDVFLEENQSSAVLSPRRLSNTKRSALKSYI